MRDARAPDARDALDERGALHEVDGDGLVLARGGERRRLAGRLGERDQVGPRDLAQVEAREHGVAELEQPEPEPVAAAVGDVLDEAGLRRASRAVARRCSALIPVRRAISFVPSSGASVGERVEDGDRALDGGDVADGWLTGSRHGRVRSVNFDTALPRRQ